MTRISLDVVADAVPEPDGHGWASQDDYRLLSMAVTLSSVDARFSDALRWHLAPFRSKRASTGALPIELLIDRHDDSGARWVFRVGTQERFRCEALTEAVHRAVWEIHGEVHDRVRDNLLLHAGAVVRDGRSLLLPARTGSGKSCLTLALLRAGWAYLSDELGAIDPVTRRALPFPKLLKLDPDAVSMFPGLPEALHDRVVVPFRLWERFVRPEDVEAPVSAAAEIGWLVFPSSDFDGPPRLEAMSRAASVEAMASNCLNLFRYGERGVVLMGEVARSTRAFFLTGGSVAARAELLCDMLG